MKLPGISRGARGITAAAGILVVLLLVGYCAFPGKPSIPPHKAIQDAIKTTSQAGSYHYDITMKTTIDGKEQAASSVKGERQSQDHIHIKGRIFDSEVDFYQIGTDTYSKDQLSGQWIKISDNQVNQQEIFMQELNPLASFSYKELTDAQYAGDEAVDGRKTWVYTATPTVDNPYMEILWRDFRYKFWIEPRTMLIIQAEVSAASKNNPDDRLNLLVKFSNYNGDIQVNPPKI